MRTTPQKLTLSNFSGDFHPLGFHLFELNSTTVLLTVTNHKRSGNVIEQFYYHFKEPIILSHVRTISHPLIHTPNAIEMLSPTKFYFSNDHTYYNGTMKVIENWTRLPGGSIVFIDLEDPNRIKVVAEGLRFANGVATRDQRFYFVAECLGGLVKIYERQTDNSLALIRSVKVGYAVDNVRVDEATGDVYVAGHPNVIKFMLYSKRNIGTSPSRVVRLRFGESNAADEILNLEKDATLTVIFEDDGSFYPTSSTAAVDNKRNTVLISGLYADGILHCSK
ncbi:hypothetical protein BKA69DRAFT_34027 [Paraphysoderma sedebokerense]|nr:hypothetical protein BKA69DRAFT_34027 [Paraphysoderma sedebokerense]